MLVPTAVTVAQQVFTQNNEKAEAKIIRRYGRHIVKTIENSAIEWLSAQTTLIPNPEDLINRINSALPMEDRT